MALQHQLFAFLISLHIIAQPLIIAAPVTETGVVESQIPSSPTSTALVPASSPYSFFSSWPQLSEISQKTINTYKPYLDDGIRQSMDAGNNVLTQTYNSGYGTAKTGSEYAWNGLAIGLGAPIVLAQKSQEMIAKNYDPNAPSKFAETVNSQLLSASAALNDFGEKRRSWLEQGIRKANQYLDSVDTYLATQLRNYATKFKQQQHPMLTANERNPNYQVQPTSSSQVQSETSN